MVVIMSTASIIGFSSHAKPENMPNVNKIGIAKQWIAHKKEAENPNKSKLSLRVRMKYVLNATMLQKYNNATMFQNLYFCK